MLFRKRTSIILVMVEMFVCVCVCDEGGGTATACTSYICNLQPYFELQKLYSRKENAKNLIE